MRVITPTITLFVSLCLLFVGLPASWGQEYLRQEETAPESVAEQQSPLEQGLEKELVLPRLFPRLRHMLQHQLQRLSPFWRDTHLALKLRTYYFNRAKTQDNPEGKGQAWALGGSLAYESGWFRDVLSIGSEVFTSQKLYGPRSTDGTRLLRPGQQEFTVVGRAYARLRFQDQQTTLYRQYLDLPYVNKDDSRMVPNTFEGYLFRGQYSRFQYGLGYIDKMKRRDSSTFISMAEVAGVPGQRKRGLLLAGARTTFVDELSLGAITYFVPDVFNTLYTEMQYTWAMSDTVGVQLGAQFTDQRSVGKDLLGTFDTQAGSAKASLSYKRAIITLAFSVTAGGGLIRSPYGGDPGYVSLMLNNFNRASEEAWLLGLSYDFRDFGWAGLTGYFNFARGTGARLADTGGSLPDVEEMDITLDYRFQHGWLHGLWVRLRTAFANEQIGSSRADNVRLIINYEFSLL